MKIQFRSQISKFIQIEIQFRSQIFIFMHMKIQFLREHMLATFHFNARRNKWIYSNEHSIYKNQLENQLENQLDISTRKSTTNFN